MLLCSCGAVHSLFIFSITSALFFMQPAVRMVASGYNQPERGRGVDRENMS
jgi:hypothetical protein